MQVSKRIARYRAVEGMSVRVEGGAQFRAHKSGDVEAVRNFKELLGVMESIFNCD